MRLQISKSVNASDWDAKICSEGGTIFHSSIWAKYNVTGNPNVIPLFITLLSDDGEFLGAALGFNECSQHKLIARFTKRLWFDAMPVIYNHDKKTLYEFLQLLESYACSSGYIELSIGSFASIDASIELERLGLDLTKRLEFELRLDRTEDDLWKGLLYKRRKNIKKAIKMGVTIHDLQPDKGVRELRRLQAESKQRILKRGGPNMAPSQQYLQDPARILVESGFGQIIAASVDGEIVSAGLFTCFNNLVYHNLSGHSQRAFQTQAPTLLLWENIKKYRNKGITKFNLSGCKASAVNENSSEHGVYSYKKAFGADLLQCASGKKILHKGRHRIAILAKTLLPRSKYQ